MEVGVILGGNNLSMVDLLHYAQMAGEAGADSVWSAVPTVSRVAMLFGQVGLPTKAGEQARERAAPGLGLTLRPFYVQRPEDFTAWVFPAIRADAPAIDSPTLRSSTGCR